MYERKQQLYQKQRVVGSGLRVPTGMGFYDLAGDARRRVPIQIIRGGMFMKLSGFIEKDNKIVAVRVEDDYGRLSDLYLTSAVGLSNLECMQAEYLRGIRFFDKQNHKSYEFITLEEIKTGKPVEVCDKSRLVHVSEVIKPVNYVETDTAYFPRERELSMYDWLYNAPDKVLYIRGARQTGKTYLVHHFIKEAFGTDEVYCVNLLDAVVQEKLKEFHRYLKDIKLSSGHNPTGVERFASFLFPDFDINTARVLYIDEIQADSGLYNCIREFAREGKCRLIVSGSYLNIISDQRSTNEKKYHYPVGGDYFIQLYGLSFSEFLRANGIVNPQVLLKDASVYSEEEKTLFREVQKLYEDYSRIGGYPAVVKDYIENEGQGFRDIMEMIFNAYMEDGQHYVQLWYPMTDLRDTLTSVASVILGVNQTFKRQDVVGKVVSDFKVRHPGVNEKTIAASLRWLVDSGIIKLVDCYSDHTFTRFGTQNGKVYFMDTGLANYFIDQAGGVRASGRSGFLAENFVYLQLFNSLSPNGRDSSLWLKTAMFQKDVNVELDFIYKPVFSEEDLVLVEVKSGNTESKSFDRYKKNKIFKKAVKFINRATDMKGESVPICLARYYTLI